MNLVQQLRDIAKMGVSDEDCLILEAADQIEKLREALQRIRDCDVSQNGSAQNRMDAVRAIAQEALE